MLKKLKASKADKNTFEFAKNIESRQSEVPISSNNKIVINYTKNGPIYGDRFIPRRRLSTSSRIISKDTNKKLLMKKIVSKNVLIWDLPAKYWLENSLITLLDNAFHISDQRILQFAEPAAENDIEQNSNWCEKLTNVEAHNSWICKARQKPLAYAESLHDALGFSDEFERHMMDWSVNGQMVACYADHITVWRTIHDASITFQVECASCLAYGPNGKYLAIGCKVAEIPVIELWDVSSYGVRVKVIWRYFFKPKSLRFECLLWSECGKFLLAGTNKGNIYVLNVQYYQILDNVQSSKSAIVSLRFSSRMRYLASSNVSGSIDIYTWYNAKLTAYLHVKWKHKTKLILDWHPFKDVYELAVAESKPAAIVMINVPSKKTTFFYRRGDRNIKIDTLAFNKITAELCISISKAGSDSYVESKILVFSSLNRIVDVLSHENGARFLMWHPDDTRLIAARNDDSLSVWNFYPKDEKTCKRKNDSDQMNEYARQKLFHGCDRGEQFRLWSNVR